jgi:flagellin-like protein
MKGISPMLATVLLIAFTIAVGGIISLFFTRLTTTQTGEAEKSATGIAECANAYIDVLDVNTTNTTALTILIHNPSRNIIYATGAFDDIGASNTTATQFQEAIASGSVARLSMINVPSGSATKVTIIGKCLNSAGTQNSSISGICTKGAACWPS